MMKTRTALVGLSVIGYLSFFGGTGEAQFNVRVDDLANPTLISTWNAPNGTVSTRVSFKSGGHAETTTLDDVNTYSESLETELYSYDVVNWPADVNWLKIYTSSNDMFGIDQVEIFRASDGAVVQTFGADNSSAWCLSTDPNDGYTSDCNGNPAHAAYFFYPNGSIVSG